MHIWLQGVFSMRPVRLRSFCLLSVLLLTTKLSPVFGIFAQEAPPANAPYKNSALSVETRVADLLGRMTVEEKATMLSGSAWMESAPIARLGIPAIKMADGPMGVRSWAGSSAITSAANTPVKVESTSFPSGVAMAATWDTAL